MAKPAFTFNIMSRKEDFHHWWLETGQFLIPTPRTGFLGAPDRDRLEYFKEIIRPVYNHFQDEIAELELKWEQPEVKK